MNKNNLIGFILIGFVLIGFSLWNRPSEEELAKQQQKEQIVQLFRSKRKLKLKLKLLALRLYNKQPPTQVLCFIRH